MQINTVIAAKNQDWQDQKALERYTLIAPLLAEGIDPAKRNQMRVTIAQQAGLSERTLYRYEAAFRERGFAGLKPVAGERSLSKKLPANYMEIVAQAIQLKKEVPQRSVEQIIFREPLNNRLPMWFLRFIRFFNEKRVRELRSHAYLRGLVENFRGQSPVLGALSPRKAAAGPKWSTGRGCKRGLSAQC